MHIFGAQLHAKPGHGGEAGQMVGKIRDAVSAAIGRPVYAWAVVAGAPVGSFALSTRLDGLGDLVDMQMQLAADEAYQKLAVKIGKVLAGPAETTLGQVIGTAGDVGEPKAVTTVTTATMAAGHVSEALAWCNDMLEFSAGVTGLGTMLTTNSAGSFFDISFIGAADSGAAADEANTALIGDPGYMERLDAAGELFVDGSAMRAVLAQLP